MIKTHAVSPVFYFLGCRKLTVSNTLLNIPLKASAAKIYEHIFIRDDLGFIPRKWS